MLSHLNAAGAHLLPRQIDVRPIKRAAHFEQRHFHCVFTARS